MLCIEVIRRICLAVVNVLQVGERFASSCVEFHRFFQVTITMKVHTHGGPPKLRPISPKFCTCCLFL